MRRVAFVAPVLLAALALAGVAMRAAGAPLVAWPTLHLAPAEDALHVALAALALLAAAWPRRLAGPVATLLFALAALGALAPGGLGLGEILRARVEPGQVAAYALAGAALARAKLSKETFSGPSDPRPGPFQPLGTRRP